LVGGGATPVFPSSSVRIFISASVDNEQKLSHRSLRPLLYGLKTHPVKHHCCDI